jgi:hypothetical protein
VRFPRILYAIFLIFPTIRFMLAAETFIPPDDTQIAQGAAFSRRDHGTSGPVNVSFPVCSLSLLNSGFDNHCEFLRLDTNANPRGTGFI